MDKFLSFLRFVEFDENIAMLYQIKGQWQQRRRPQPEDSDDEQPSNYFQADQIAPISKKNERKIWLKIKQMSQEFLARYPTTLDEDLEILQRTDLTFNMSNATLFRSGEKVILHHLIEMADYVLNLLEMSFKNAKKHTQTLPTKMESSRDYIQNYVVKLLADNK